MNDANEPFEEELAALRPRELSPGFRRRIARRLAVPGPKPSGWRWGIALTGGLAAACLAAFLFGQGGGEVVETRHAVVIPSPVPPDPVDDAMPTLRAYRRVVTRSPEELDAVLDKQA